MSVQIYDHYVEIDFGLASNVKNVYKFNRTTINVVFERLPHIVYRFQVPEDVMEDLMFDFTQSEIKGMHRTIIKIPRFVEKIDTNENKCICF